MQHLIIMHLATVNTALNNLYNNYLKGWSTLLAVVAIALGGMLWMIGSAVGNSGVGAIGIRVAAIAVIGVAIILGATDLVGIGKSLGI